MLFKISLPMECDKKYPQKREFVNHIICLGITNNAFNCAIHVIFSLVMHVHVQKMK